MGRKARRNRRCSCTLVGRLMPPPLEPGRALQHARRQTDALFRVVRPGSLYSRPIGERHRIVFYLGHMDAFDWNLMRSEEHTSELQSLRHLVCRLLLEKKKID